MTVALDDVDLTSSAVGECGNLPCALIPAHCSDTTVEGFNKVTVWFGVMAKPLVSVLLLSALHPCSKMADTLFVE